MLSIPPLDISKLSVQADVVFTNSVALASFYKATVKNALCQQEQALLDDRACRVSTLMSKVCMISLGDIDP